MDVREIVVMARLAYVTIPWIGSMTSRKKWFRCSTIDDIVQSYSESVHHSIPRGRHHILLYAIKYMRIRANAQTPKIIPAIIPAIISASIRDSLYNHVCDVRVLYCLATQPVCDVRVLSCLATKGNHIVYNEIIKVYCTSSHAYSFET